MRWRDPGARAGWRAIVLLATALFGVTLIEARPVVGKTSRIVYIEASTGNGWKLPEFPRRVNDARFDDWVRTLAGELKLPFSIWSARCGSATRIATCETNTTLATAST